MGRERWIRGEQQGGEALFDWLGLAREHAIPADTARTLYEEAVRRARQEHRLDSRRYAEAIYRQRLEEARMAAWQPSPGKVTRTMRLQAERAGHALPRSHISPRTRQPIAPGKRPLTDFLAPSARESRHASPETAALYRNQARVKTMADSAAESEREALTARWLDTAMRPDLHPPPVSSQRADEERAPATTLPAGSGSSLPADVQAKMEQAFSVDFSAVRIHEGPEAKSVGARAYAQGTDIHFAPGRYDPHSPAGQKLLGHELTHIVQQAQGRGRATTRIHGRPVNDDPMLEQEADDMGARAARGEHAYRGSIPMLDIAASLRAAPAPVLARDPDDETQTPTVTVDQVLRHLAEERWDVDSLAAQLTDEQMRTLAANDRVRLIDTISGGTVVANDDEQTIVRLLATTPAAQAGRVRSQLGTELLQQLDAAIDFDDYRDYHTALRGLFFQSLSPEEAATQMASARVFPWADPGLIHALWNVRFYYEEVELHDDGKLHISYWTNFAAFGMRTEEVQLDPFEMIAVRFYYPEEYADAQRDQTIYMPAINLRGLHRHQFRNELQTAVDVGLLAAGGAGIAGAGPRLARIIAALDLAVGVADLTIRDFRQEIARTEQGRDFLAAWDVVSTVIAAYGITRAVLEAPRAFRRLRDAFQRLRGAGSDVPSGTMQRIESEVDEVLQHADEAEDAAASAGRGDAAEGGQQRHEGGGQARAPGQYPVADWTQGTNMDALIRSHGTHHRGRFPQQSPSGGREVLFRRTPDGNVTAYMVYDDVGLPVKRVDVDPSSAAHAGIAPPHVVDYMDNVTPNDRAFRRPGATRPARPEEVANLRNDL